MTSEVPPTNGQQAPTSATRSGTCELARQTPGNIPGARWYRGAAGGDWRGGAARSHPACRRSHPSSTRRRERAGHRRNLRYLAHCRRCLE